MRRTENFEWRFVVERVIGECGTGIGNRRQRFVMEDVKWKALNEDPLMESGDWEQMMLGLGLG